MHSNKASASRSLLFSGKKAFGHSRRHQWRRKDLSCFLYTHFLEVNETVQIIFLMTASSQRSSVSDLRRGMQSYKDALDDISRDYLRLLTQRQLLQLDNRANQSESDEFTLFKEKIRRKKAAESPEKGQRTTVKPSSRYPYDPKLRVSCAQKKVYNVRDVPIGQRSDRGYNFSAMTDRREFQIEPKPDLCASRVQSSPLSKPKAQAKVSGTRKYGPLDWYATGNHSRSQTLGIHATAVESKATRTDAPYVNVRSQRISRPQSAKETQFTTSKRFDRSYITPTESPGPIYRQMAERRPSSALIGPKSVRSPTKKSIS